VRYADPICLRHSTAFRAMSECSAYGSNSLRQRHRDHRAVMLAGAELPRRTIYEN